MNSISTLIAALPEYQRAARIMDQVAALDRQRGREFRGAVDRCLTDLALGNLDRQEAAALLEATRSRLASAAVGQEFAARVRLDGLLDELTGYLCGRMLDAVMAARAAVQNAA